MWHFCFVRCDTMSLRQRLKDCRTVFLVAIALLFLVVAFLIFAFCRKSSSDINSINFVRKPAVFDLKGNYLEVNFDRFNEEKDSKEVSSARSVSTSTANYTKLYPDLCTIRPEKQFVLSKTVFFTFDDGPSERTPEILDILKHYGIKATFFVVGKTSDFAKKCMKRIVEEGHTIAMHSYTHDFKKIYENVESFLYDINKLYNLINETTGVKPSIFRFAGGSKNSYNKHNYKEIIAEMIRRGFDYFDWNLCNNDAISRTPMPVNKCIDNVLKYSEKYDTAVILMHDSQPKKTTVEALPKIIEGLKKQGFSFEKLTNQISPKEFSLTKPYA